MIMFNNNMPQAAILTKFIPPTNNKPSRIKASCKAGSIEIAYDYTGDACHRKAAQKLAEKFKWSGTLAEGTHPDGKHLIFIFI